MDLRGLKQRLAHLASAIPRDLPEVGASVESVDMALTIGAVWSALESWAVWQPGYEAMPAPTVWRKSDDADRRMAAQCAALRDLAEPHLTHSADALAARLSRLYAEYATTGQHDEAIDRALADVRERLAALTADGAPIPQWCAKFLSQIATDNPAGS
jgi:hypothetical protein